MDECGMCNCRDVYTNTGPWLGGGGDAIDRTPSNMKRNTSFKEGTEDDQYQW